MRRNRRWRVDSQCRRLWVMAGVSLALVASVFVASAVYGDVDANITAQYDPPLLDPSQQLGPNTVFLTAGTIMGLAVFGTALGLRIERKPKKKEVEWRAKVLAFIMLVAIVMVQGWVMGVLLMGGETLVYAWIWMGVTTSSLALLMFFIVLGNSYSKDEGDDSSKSEEPKTGGPRP